MSTIKPFSGFTTPDGMVHPTRTAAEKHVSDQKLMAELHAFACEKAPQFPEEMMLDYSIEAGTLMSWLYNNRDALARIFTGAKNVSVRKPRADKGKPRKKKAVYIPGPPTESGAPATH